jgi:putative nucleotidyltransferase with HDIG domain
MVDMKNIEEFAEECYKRFPDYPRVWEEHILPVRKFAVRLAEIEKADREVVEIAALLHDIGRYKNRDDHHLTGYEMTKNFLEDIEMEDHRKMLILKCVLKHRSRSAGEENEMEVRVVQCADALGTLFDDNWQEKSRNSMKKEELLALYEKSLGKVTLESAKKMAEPRVRYLKSILE